MLSNFHILYGVGILVVSMTGVGGWDQEELDAIKHQVNSLGLRTALQALDNIKTILDRYDN